MYYSSEHTVSLASGQPRPFCTCVCVCARMHAGLTHIYGALSYVGVSFHLHGWVTCYYPSCDTTPSSCLLLPSLCTLLPRMDSNSALVLLWTTASRPRPRHSFWIHKAEGASPQLQLTKCLWSPRELVPFTCLCLCQLCDRQRVASDTDLRAV